MRSGKGFWAVAILSLGVSAAAADPVSFHPAGCDFEIAFPAAPATSETKTDTDRGDSVATEHASLNDGTNYLRAECTHVPAMNFFDEGILLNNMKDLSIVYKLDHVLTSIDHNDVSGPIGVLHGQGKLAGKDVTIEIRRFTGKASIFDVWIASAPGGFPTQNETDFLKTIKVEGKPVP